MSEGKKYARFFIGICMDERDADKEAAAGHPQMADALRNMHQKLIGLNDQQYADLKRVVFENRDAQRVVMEKFLALRAEAAAKVPAGTPPPTVDHAATQALDDEATAITLNHIAALKAVLGPNGTAKVEAFIARSVVGHSKTPSPAMAHPSPAQLEGLRSAHSAR